MGLRQRSANVCRHVVWTFSPMFKQEVTVRYQTRKESFEILQHFRISVFLDQKAG